VPATTLNQSIALMGESLLKELLTEFFVVPDPAFSRMPMVLSPLNWQQQYVYGNHVAMVKSYYGAMASDDFFTASYNGFLNELYRQDDRTMQIALQTSGYKQFDDRLTKKRTMFEALSALARQNTYIGQPSTTTVGAVLIAAGIADVVPSGRWFEMTDVHALAGVSTIHLYFDWNGGTNTLRMMKSTDSTWGPGVVITLTNFHKVPLYDVTGTKWCWVTCSAGGATLMAAGNFTSVGGAGDHVDLVPNFATTGFLTQVAPEMRMFGNLSASNPTVTGDAISQRNLSWMRMKLLDSSNGDASRCCILLDDIHYLNAEAIITALATGSGEELFMGSKLSALRYGNIPVLRCPWLPTVTAANTTTTGLGQMLGLVLGEDRCFIRYNSTAGDVSNTTTADNMSSVAVQGNLPSGIVLPVHYREIGEGATTELVTMRATMLFEPVSANLHACCLVTDLT
jgi:hypothetical protein